MAKLRAAVLAAGRGVRMRNETPKPLVPVRTNEPLLYYVATGLAKAGIKDVLVVTGYRAAEVEAFMAKHAEELDIRYVFNARYASWGNFYSVLLAIEQSPGHDLLVVNSDVVINPDVYGRAARSRGDLVLAVERRYALDLEDMRVRLDGDRVRAIGKDLQQRLSDGEFDGVSLVRPEAAARYAAAAADLEWSGRTALYYEDVYARLLTDVDARAVFVNPGEYAEVDTPDDVDRAAAVIERLASVWNG